MCCTVSCWILRDHGNREWISNFEEEVNLIKAQYTQTWSNNLKPPWTINIHLILKNEGQEGKINLFLRWLPVGGDGHKERGNEDEYGGCVLYPYLKIEEWNLLK
jgi:hypothetical protein